MNPSERTAPAEGFEIAGAGVGRGPAMGAGYAWSVAEGSWGRYQMHARRARRLYQLSEILFLVLSAAIPVSVVLWSGTAVVSAVLGAVLVVLSGLRSVFHWHDNYVRFSRAREAVNAEQRRYLTSSEPYADLLTRDRVLVAAVTRIEQQEMGQWIQAVSQRPGADKPRES